MCIGRFMYVNIHYMKVCKIFNFCFIIFYLYFFFRGCALIIITDYNARTDIAIAPKVTAKYTHLHMYVLCLFVCMYVLLCKLMFLSNMSTNALVWRLTGFLCPKTQLRLLLTTYVHTF